MSDINDDIAKAKGWTWHEETFFLAPDFGSVPELRTHWLAPILDGERYAEPAMRPDFVGTVEDLAGMMRILGPEWSWGWDGTQYICCDEGGYGFPVEEFCSSNERPGDCVGAAYMSVFDKETDDD